jgi:hypothetical protein
VIHHLVHAELVLARNHLAEGSPISSRAAAAPWGTELPQPAQNSNIACGFRHCLT